MNISEALRWRREPTPVPGRPYHTSPLLDLRLTSGGAGWAPLSVHSMLSSLHEPIFVKVGHGCHLRIRSSAFVQMPRRCKRSGNCDQLSVSHPHSHPNIRKIRNIRVPMKQPCKWHSIRPLYHQRIPWEYKSLSSFCHFSKAQLTPSGSLWHLRNVCLFKSARACVCVYNTNITVFLEGKRRTNIIYQPP